MSVQMYQVRRLAVQLGGRDALALDHLEIAPAAVTAVVGPNGAGKSTLLRVLAFLQRPTRGDVDFDGARVSWREVELARLRQRVTLVGQHPYLFRRTVRANLRYGLRCRGRADDERIGAALAAVGLAGLGDRQSAQLSAGEAQRVAVARAIALETPVLLLDEPTASVDRAHVGVIEAVVENLRRRGRTVVLATHDPAQADRLADHVVSL